MFLSLVLLVSTKILRKLCRSAVIGIQCRIDGLSIGSLDPKRNPAHAITNPDLKDIGFIVTPRNTTNMMMHGAIGLEITALTGYLSSIVDPHGRGGGMKARKKKRK